MINETNQTNKEFIMNNYEKLLSSYTGAGVGIWRYGNEEHCLFWFSDPAPVVIRLADGLLR
jgi:hypothetical protein